MMDLEEWFKARRITEVECLIPDMTGNARGKIMPAHKYLQDLGMRLPESIFVQTVTGDWVYETDVVSETDIDMVAKADLSSVRLVPWAQDPTAQIIHDCQYFDGSPVPLSPRGVLRRVLALYDDLGLKPIVAPELEFYFTKINTDPDYPLEPPTGRNGRQETGRQAYSIDATNQFDPVFEDIYDYCEAQELDVDTLIHESGAAQMEINFEHGEPLHLADQVFLFKRTVREAALKHKIYATFMAKPMANEPGSAMHLHQSLVCAKHGHNVFAKGEGYSETFLHFLAGQQKYLPEVMAIFAPNVNSYRRFARNEAAPINTAWGRDNRTVGLRVPFSSPEALRIENRLAGADANPYLAIAASLAAGYLGIIEKRQPSDPLGGNVSAYDLPYGVPRNLSDALLRLQRCEPMRELLGERFVTVYEAVKRNEYDTFFQVISSWEREYLLLNV